MLLTVHKVETRFPDTCCIRGWTHHLADFTAPPCCAISQQSLWLGHLGVYFACAGGCCALPRCVPCLSRYGSSRIRAGARTTKVCDSETRRKLTAPRSAAVHIVHLRDLPVFLLCAVSALQDGSSGASSLSSPRLSLYTRCDSSHQRIHGCRMPDNQLHAAQRDRCSAGTVATAQLSRLSRCQHSAT